MIFLFILIANLWIWYILSSNLLLAIALFMTSFLLFKSLQNKTLLLPFYISFLTLSFLQISTTSIQSLSEVSKQEELIQINRLKEYPPVYLSIGGKTLWIPAAYWLESRKETISARHFVKNVFETINPNAYFFANHPRERIGVREFEKFPYIFFPFFLYGAYRLITQHTNVSTVILGASLVLLGIIGHNNPQGPFLIFPFVVSSISLGIAESYKFVKKSKFSKYIVLSFSFLCIGVLVQVISYAYH